MDFDLLPTVVLLAHLTLISDLRKDIQLRVEIRHHLIFYAAVIWYFNWILVVNKHKLQKLNLKHNVNAHVESRLQDAFWEP